MENEISACRKGGFGPRCKPKRSLALAKPARLPSLLQTKRSLALRQSQRGFPRCCKPSVAGAAAAPTSSAASLGASANFFLWCSANQARGQAPLGAATAPRKLPLTRQRGHAARAALLCRRGLSLH